MNTPQPPASLLNGQSSNDQRSNIIYIMSDDHAYQAIILQ